jgi:hypothetical protein
MTEGQGTITGGCMCGAVRYEASGDPLSVIFCHCESCRKHTGAPVVTLAGFKKDQVRYTAGERATYESSPGVLRGFCSRCGTPLTWEGDGDELGPLVEIHVGTTDNATKLAPQLHVHFAERIPWFEVSDNLPRYHEWEEEDGLISTGPVAEATSD